MDLDGGSAGTALYKVWAVNSALYRLLDPFHEYF